MEFIRRSQIYLTKVEIRRLRVLPLEAGLRAYKVKLQFSIFKYQIIFNSQITILKQFFYWVLTLEYYLFFVI